MFQEKRSRTNIGNSEMLNKKRWTVFVGFDSSYLLSIIILIPKLIDKRIELNLTMLTLRYNLENINSESRKKIEDEKNVLHDKRCKLK